MKTKHKQWLKIGLLIVLPAPITGMVLLGWGAHKLIKEYKVRNNELKGKTTSTFPVDGANRQDKPG